MLYRHALQAASLLAVGLCATLGHAQPKLDKQWSMPSESWEYQTIIGDDDTFTTTTLADAFSIRVNEFGGFGFHQSEDLAGDKPPLTATNILGVQWTWSTDAENPEDVPEVRLRMTARDGTFTQSYLLQDAFLDDGHVSANLPTAGNDYSILTFADVPQSIVNGKPYSGADGYALAFDVMSFNTANPARLGRSVALKQVRAFSLNPGDLDAEGGNVVNQSFPTDGAEWVPSDPNIAGRPVEHLLDERGLGLRTFGPGDADPDEEGKYNFPFGWWELPDALTLRADRVYRVKFVVSLDHPSEDDVAAMAIPTRLRLADENLDYSAMVSIGSLQVGDLDNNPDKEGKNFFAWVTFPPELAATEPTIDLYWEVWQDTQPIAEGTSMFLKEIQIKEYTYLP